jgi:Zn-dependent protease with chaperone function
VPPATRDLRERRLLNVVEEMAIAAGIAMPHVFVLDRERGMNAFAAGFATKDAAVAVTRGLLETLNRDELQAVIGHEFSHILNGDMRLNIRLIAVLHGIFSFTILGMILIHLSRHVRGKNSGGPKIALLVLGAMCWLVGQAGVFFGRLIQCSISRQREFLADASAVQFTRNPDGLASVLKLLAAKGGNIDLPSAAAVSHMLFAAGSSTLFETHPPLAARIRKVEPGFNGSFKEARAELARRMEAQKPKQQGSHPGGTPPPLHEGGIGQDTEDERIIAGTLYGVRHALRYEEGGVKQFPSRGGVAEGRGGPSRNPDLSWLSDEDRDMLHDPLSAQCCVCGALLDADTRVRDLQLAMLPHRFENDTEFTDACLAWRERMRDWTVRQRRIACELAVATLRSAPPDVLKKFCASIDKLVRADSTVDPFEFALTCMIRRRLQTAASLAHARQPTVAPNALKSEIARVLSMIAAFEAGAQAAQDAWAAGLQRIQPYTGPLVMPASLRDFDAFDAALSKLERLPPLFKREFMLACQAIAEHDNTITDTEENFLFAIADAIDAIGWNAGAGEVLEFLR